MSQQPAPGHLTPEDVRRLVIAITLAGAAIDERDPPGWIVERAFHLGDRVREMLLAEERGEVIKQWERANRHDSADS